MINPTYTHRKGRSNFTTISSQFAFMTYPELAAHTATLTFDSEDLVAGNMDLFVVAPEELLDRIRVGSASG